MSRYYDQAINRQLIHDYVYERVEVSATEIADYVSKKLGYPYLATSASRVMGNFACWDRKKVRIGKSRVVVFRNHCRLKS